MEMWMEPGILFSIAVTLVGAVAWAVRVEGRVNSHAELFKERESRTAERHQEIQRRLERIERKVDSLSEAQS